MQLYASNWNKWIYEQNTFSYIWHTHQLYCQLLSLQKAPYPSSYPSKEHPPLFDIHPPKQLLRPRTEPWPYSNYLYPCIWTLLHYIGLSTPYIPNSKPIPVLLELWNLWPCSYLERQRNCMWPVRSMVSWPMPKHRYYKLWTVKR